MIINISYFLLPPLEVPNAKTVAGSPDATAQLQAVIDSTEYDFLINSLGYDQTAELLNQFTETGDWKPDALQKWKDLVDGKDKWLGLRFTIGTNKVSVIAYLVYYNYLKSKRMNFGTTGLERVTPENSVAINPTEELVDKWNKFVCMYQGGYNYQYYNWWNPIFFEWNGYPYGYANHTDNKYSMYQFLNDNTDTYDNTFFRFYETKNRFGI